MVTPALWTYTKRLQMISLIWRQKGDSINVVTVPSALAHSPQTPFSTFCEVSTSVFPYLGTVRGSISASLLGDTYVGIVDGRDLRSERAQRKLCRREPCREQDRLPNRGRQPCHLCWLRHRV